ncbi:MAG: hypothetical protein JXR40_11545 [Pontiellaceae bacterium]|nr:hypothetical protein [Pontiellaceae bacterium]
MKRVFVVVLTMLTIFAHGETFKAGEVYTISLPEGWCELSEPFLSDFAERVRRNMEWAEPQPYDYAYQVGEEYGLNFKFPCILVNIVPGRLLPPKLQLLADQAKKSDEARYDKEHRIFWTTEIETMGDEKLVRRIALKQTKDGFIRFIGCVPEDGYAEFRPTFEKAVISAVVNEEIRYKPSLFEDLPPIFGLNTGLIIQWTLQSLLIGGLLWGVYVLVKRAVRRMRAKKASLNSGKPSS